MCIEPINFINIKSEKYFFLYFSKIGQLSPTPETIIFSNAKEVLLIVTYLNALTFESTGKKMHFLIRTNCLSFNVILFVFKKQRLHQA